MEKKLFIAVFLIAAVGVVHAAERDDPDVDPGARAANSIQKPHHKRRKKKKVNLSVTPEEPGIAGTAGSPEGRESNSQVSATITGTSPEAPYGPWTLRDDGIYYGPAIGGGAYQPDAYHAQTTYPTFLRNYVALGYYVSKQWLVGGAYVSDFFPNGQSYLVPLSSDSNRYMSVDDSFVRLMAPKWIQTPHLKASLDLRLYAPASYLSRDFAGQGYSFQARFIPNYTFPASRWSVGAIFKDTYFFTHYAWASGPNGAIINDSYFGPMVNYQVSRTIAVGLFAEFETERYVGNQGFFDYTNNNPENPTPWDLEPNVSWDITPNVNLNPFLEIYPGGKIAWDQIQMGFLFGAKLF